MPLAAVKPMPSLLLKTGLDLPLQGAPALRRETLPPPAQIALTPVRIPLIRPRLKVAVGDRVKLGSLLCEDKRDARLRLLSPGGGEIVDIRFGPRRVIDAIVIALDKEEEAVAFATLSSEQIKGMTRHALVDHLLQGGLWPLIKALPFRTIASPDETPPAIYVGLGGLEPFQARPELYLQGRRPAFELGMTLLGRLAPEVRLGLPLERGETLQALSHLASFDFKGPYPSDDPGVHCYYQKQDPAENRCWFIRGQDLLLLAELCMTGRYPVQRLVALGGSRVHDPLYLDTRMGVPLADLVKGRLSLETDVRFVVGGVLTGYRESAFGFLGWEQTALTVLPAGEGKEFLGFVRPGLRKHSFSRAFIASLKHEALAMDCNLHGEERPCVACSNCARVCPVEILPQLAYKSALAGEVEEALAHGLLDCVECGLCTYVCPSKIELSRNLTAAKRSYLKERTA
jgi:Na+-transporting NADH:ubiquinone oxidoreductase subunit A